jgi:hypothetical protein
MPAVQEREEASPELPDRELLLLEPNPVLSQATVRFNLPSSGHVTLKIYDVVGRLVVTLVDEWREVGIYSIGWDGSALRSGVYLCQLEVEGHCESKKVVVLEHR